MCISPFVSSFAGLVAAGRAYAFGAMRHTAAMGIAAQRRGKIAASNETDARILCKTPLATGSDISSTVAAATAFFDFAGRGRGNGVRGQCRIRGR
jgi:hypothetical protein